MDQQQQKQAPRSAAERKRDERARKAAAGLVRVAVDVPARHAAWLQQTAARLRAGGEPPHAGAQTDAMTLREIEHRLERAIELVRAQFVLPPRDRS